MKSIEDRYNEYLEQHISNVKQAYKWLKEYMPYDLESVDCSENIKKHDSSKWSDEEFDAYARYFYGTKTKNIEKEFDYAWLHHIHNNPHHWQYWLLKNDDGELEALEMPKEYVIEMFCDWLSFSFKVNDIQEIFKFYDKNKHKMILHKNTRKLVEKLLKNISDRINCGL